MRKATPTRRALHTQSPCSLRMTRIMVNAVAYMAATPILCPFLMGMVLVASAFIFQAKKKTKLVAGSSFISRRCCKPIPYTAVVLIRRRAINRTIGRTTTLCSVRKPPLSFLFAKFSMCFLKKAMLTRSAKAVVGLTMVMIRIGKITSTTRTKRTRTF